MDAFDPHYDVEIKESIFPEYNKNKFIDGKIVYFFDDGHKCNII